MTLIGQRQRTPRVDAERNRVRVLDAAAKVFAEYGGTATLGQVARAAGVGVGTVYRKFPDKEAVLEALIDDKIAALVHLAEVAASNDHPGEAVRGLLLGVMEVRAGDRGLDAIFNSPKRAEQFTAGLNRAFVPTVESLITRAIAAGELRAGFTGQEVCLLGFMVGKLADITRPDHPDLWRRYAQVLIDGTRPAAAVQPLSPPPISFSDAATALGRAI